MDDIEAYLQSKLQKELHKFIFDPPDQRKISDVERLIKISLGYLNPLRLYVGEGEVIGRNLVVPVIYKIEEDERFKNE